MNEMLGSLLSDPESMEQIKELADMLREETSSVGGSSDKSGGSGAGLASLAGMLGGQNGINPDIISALSSVLSAMNGEDKNRTLLLALRPHLSGEKQEKLDKAVRMLKIYAAVNALKDSGVLGNIDKLI